MLMIKTFCLLKNFLCLYINVKAAMRSISDDGWDAMGRVVGFVIDGLDNFFLKQLALKIL